MPTYLIRITIAGDHPTVRERVVEASNQAQAIRHVVSDTVTCEVASVQEAMKLAAQGVKLERAEDPVAA